MSRTARVVLVLVSVAVAAALAPIASAKTPNPVPSLQPKQTQQLWQRLVHRQHTFAAADCRPARAIFYTATDWLRLATKLAANESLCAQYYISIPPLAADKTNFRPDQPWRIRALGPNFHVLCEINYTGWSKWVIANNSTFYDAGVEARRRMAAQGFDVAAGDTWIVNEFSSGVRANTGTAREKVRDLVRGLYTGDGTVPQVKGGVYITGIGQSTADLSTYKVNLQNWYLDAPFWDDMNAYVSDWSQEVYGDVRDYAVTGAPIDARAEHLNDYLEHALSLANAAPAEAATAQGFIRSTYGPLANAAWIYQSAFGFTDVPLPQMQDYVTAQTYAMRVAGHNRFGFAWAPKMVDNTAWTSDFTVQSGQLLDRLAQSIHESDESAAAACGDVWCTAGVDGAAFVETWKTFTTWSQPALGFTTPAAALTAGTASAPITVQLQTSGVTQTTDTPATVTLSSSSAAGTFSATADGPWTSTLDVAIPVGSSSATFYYRDTAAGTPTITAATPGRQSTTQQETVAAAALASMSISPTSAALTVGGTRTFAVSGADPYGNPVTPAPTWSTTAPGTLSSTTGTSTTFTATAAGSGTVVATAGSLTASASVSITATKVRVSSIVYARSSGRLTITVSVVNASGAAVPNASVGLRITRSGWLFASGTWQTNATGKVVLTTSSTAPRGCYATTITSLTATGYAWDGVTPSNGLCF